MQFTDYHAKYFAYELTKRSPSDSVDKLAGAVAGAQVDLNPHQVDAALFAFSSPRFLRGQPHIPRNASGNPAQTCRGNAPGAKEPPADRSKHGFRLDFRRSSLARWVFLPFPSVGC